MDNMTQITDIHVSVNRKSLLERFITVRFRIFVVIEIQVPLLRR